MVIVMPCPIYIFLFPKSAAAFDILWPPHKSVKKNWLTYTPHVQYRFHEKSKKPKKSTKKRFYIRLKLRYTYRLSTFFEKIFCSSNFTIAIRSVNKMHFHGIHEKWCWSSFFVSGNAYTFDCRVERLLISTRSINFPKKLLFGKENHLLGSFLVFTSDPWEYQKK